METIERSEKTKNMGMKAKVKLTFQVWRSPPFSSFAELRPNPK